MLDRGQQYTLAARFNTECGGTAAACRVFAADLKDRVEVYRKDCPQLYCQLAAVISQLRIVAAHLENRSDCIDDLH